MRIENYSFPLDFPLKVLFPYVNEMNTINYKIIIDSNQKSNEMI